MILELKGDLDELKRDVKDLKAIIEVGERVERDIGQVKDVEEVKGGMEGMKANLEEVAKNVEEVKVIVHRQEIARRQPRK